MTDPLAQRVTELVAAQARRDPAEVGPQDTPASLGLDSLNMVELVFAIEEAFDLQVPFSPEGTGAPGFDASTVAAMIQAVRGLVAERQE